MQNREVLKGVGVPEQVLDHHRGFANRLETFRGHRPDHPGRQGRSGKRDARKHLRRKPERLANRPHAVLAELDERLDDAIPKGFFGIDPELFEDIVLPFDPGDGLIDIGQDRALQEKIGPACLDKAPEDLAVEGLGDGLAFLLGVGDPGQSRKEFVSGIDYLDRDLEGAKPTYDLFRLSLAHQAVFDEDGLEPIPQGLMAKERDGRRIDAAGESIDGDAFAHCFSDGSDFFCDKLPWIERLQGNLVSHGSGFLSRGGIQGSQGWSCAAVTGMGSGCLP